MKGETGRTKRRAHEKVHTSLEAVDGRRDLNAPSDQLWKAGKEEEEHKSEGSCGKEQTLWPFQARKLDVHHGAIAGTENVALSPELHGVQVLGVRRWGRIGFRASGLSFDEPLS